MNPRQRTEVHLARLRSVALNTAVGVVAAACSPFKTVDPMPGPYDTYETGDGVEVWENVLAGATWTSTGNVTVTVSGPFTLSAPTVTGGVLVGSSSGDEEWGGEVDPDDGATEVLLFFNLMDGDLVVDTVVVHLDVTGTPSTGAEVPTYTTQS